MMGKKLLAVIIFSCAGLLAVPALAAHQVAGQVPQVQPLQPHSPLTRPNYSNNINGQPTDQDSMFFGSATTSPVPGIENNPQGQNQGQTPAESAPLAPSASGGGFRYAATGILAVVLLIIIAGLAYRYGKKT